MVTPLVKHSELSHDTELYRACGFERRRLADQRKELPSGAGRVTGALPRASGTNRAADGLSAQSASFAVFSGEWGGSMSLHGIITRVEIATTFLWGLPSALGSDMQNLGQHWGVTRQTYRTLAI